LLIFVHVAAKLTEICFSSVFSQILVQALAISDYNRLGTIYNPQPPTNQPLFTLSDMFLALPHAF
jgi:hypothetical protein